MGEEEERRRGKIRGVRRGGERGEEGREEEGRGEEGEKRRGEGRGEEGRKEEGRGGLKGEEGNVEERGQCKEDKGRVRTESYQ